VATVKEWGTPGNYTFTVPAEVYSITSYMIGGGGSGSNYYNRSYQGGGYAGQIRKDTHSVTPGQRIPVHVGAGGAAPGTGAHARSGGYSSFKGVVANGGSGSHDNGNYAGNHGARSTYLGKFYDGRTCNDSRFRGGQAGFGNGGHAEKPDKPCHYSPLNGSRGAGGGGSDRAGQVIIMDIQVEEVQVLYAYTILLQAERRMLLLT